MNNNAMRQTVVRIVITANSLEVRMLCFVTIIIVNIITAVAVTGSATSITASQLVLPACYIGITFNNRVPLDSIGSSAESAGVSSSLNPPPFITS